MNQANLQSNVQANLETQNKTKEQIILAIQECAARLGHPPNRDEFVKGSKITRRSILALFANYGEALRQAGFEAQAKKPKLPSEALFLDWAEIVRKLGQIPSRAQYEALSRYSPTPLMLRFGKWSAVPSGMLDFAEANNLAAEWGDVLAIVRARSNALENIRNLLRPASVALTAPLPGLRSGSPQYGEPLGMTSLLGAPTNEMGVVFLFGALAWQLGFAVLRLQAAFPDCEALRRMDENRWQIVRIEFEFESRNFQAHGHDPEKCDLIVCWKNNWPESPVEVLELSKFLGK
ncbi:MAG TPA: hypothetical protein VJN64_03070 [Terriglobales bacterium]|nr:hypothetical protein [Terriglobales bacterium]